MSSRNGRGTIRCDIIIEEQQVTGRGVGRRVVVKLLSSMKGFPEKRSSRKVLPEVSTTGDGASELRNPATTEAFVKGPRLAFEENSGADTTANVPNVRSKRKSSLLIRKLDNFAQEDADGELEKLGLVAQEQLWSECEKKLLASAEYPMNVVEFAAFEAHGSIPRSDAGLQALRQDWHIVFFISHRWWNSGDEPNPEDAGAPIKHTMICRAIRELQKSEQLDMGRIVIWVDFASIEQDDPVQQAAGINSLLTYALRSEYLLIPVYPRKADSASLAKAAHPFELLNFGERAWCRLEIFVFSCVAQLKQIDVKCYACGVEVPKYLPDERIDEQMKVHAMVPAMFPCLPRTRRTCLRQLFKQGDAWFTPEYRPSAGRVSREGDRALVLQIEEDVREFASTYQIMAEVNRFEKPLPGDRVLNDSDSRRKPLRSRPFFMQSYESVGRRDSRGGRASFSITEERGPVEALPTMNSQSTSSGELSFAAKMVACSDVPFVCGLLIRPTVFERLTSLSLRSNQLRADGIRRLFVEFICTEYAEQVSNLDLGENLLNVDGGHALAELMTSPLFKVKHLSLGSNQLGDSAAAIVMACAGKTLQVLDLKNNCIGDSGAQIFCDMLEPTKPDPESISQIRCLDFSDNEISSAGVQNMAKFFCSTERFVDNVERISLEDNNISDDGAERAVSLLRRYERATKKVLEFQFSGNPLSPSFWDIETSRMWYDSECV